MSRNKTSIISKCKLCGKEQKMSFEHVPPEAAFNKGTTKCITGDAIIKTVESGRVPWDLTGIPLKTQQRGRGDYYLCSECNNNTGSWYISHYVDFVKCFHHAVQEYQRLTDPKGDVLVMEFPGMRPLPIFKAVMTMFCDINHDCFGDENLREFLLDKESNNLDKKKYRVFIHAHAGEMERVGGLTTLIYKTQDSFEAIYLSGISTYPLGLTLYLDMPDDYIPQGCDITCFLEFSYESLAKVQLTVPLLETNIFFVGDYRTKEDILECMEKNKTTKNDSEFEES